MCVCFSFALYIQTPDECSDDVADDDDPLVVDDIPESPFVKEACAVMPGCAASAQVSTLEPAGAQGASVEASCSARLE